MEFITKAHNKIKSGEFESAIYDLDSLLGKNPNFVLALKMKGDCHVYVQQLDSACICYLEGIVMGSEQLKERFTAYCDNYKPFIDTEKFRNGKFKCLKENYDTTAYVIRDSIYQIEYSKNSKYYVKYKIKWNSDNTFTLNFIDSNDKDISILEPDEKVIVRIIKSKRINY